MAERFQQDAPQAAADSAPQAANVPDWMSELAPSAEPATSFSNANDTTSAESDWLSDFSTDAPQAAADSAPEAANVPDWMSELAPSAEPATSFSNTNDTTSAESDWLSDFSTDAPQAAADSAPQAANVPDWMSELAPSAEPATSFSNANDTASAESDWLSDFSTDAPQAATDSAPQAANVPDWMSELAPSAEPATSFSNTNDTASAESDWLSDFSTDAPQAAADAAPQAANVPDWMSELAPSAEPATSFSNTNDTTSAESDWLSDFSTDAPQAATSSDDDWQHQFEKAGETSEFDTSTEDAAPVEDAMPDTTADGQPVAQDDWLQQPHAEPALEDDWLNSFEAQPAAATPLPTSDWLENLSGQPSAAEPSTASDTAETWSNAPQAAHDDWLSQFSEAETALPVAAENNQQTQDNAPQDESPSWLSEIAPLDTSENDSPDWLTSESNAQMDSVLQATAQTARQPRVIGETGVLDPATLPDWMNAFSDEPITITKSQPAPQAETLSAPTDADFNNWNVSPAEAAAAEIPELPDIPDLLPDLEPEMSTAEPAKEQFDPSNVPDWLAAMAPDEEAAAPLSASAAAKASMNTEASDTSVPDWLQAMRPAENDTAPVSANRDAADLDFDNLGALDPVFDDLESAEPAATIPDWLGAPQAEQPAAQSAARPTVTLDDLDFGDLESAEPAATIPDWLGAPQTEQPAAQSAAHPTVTLDDLDFGSDFDEPLSDFDDLMADLPDVKPVAKAPADPVAQPAQMVDTQSRKSTPSTSGFTFNRPPAWLRKLPGAGGDKRGRS